MSNYKESTRLQKRPHWAVEHHLIIPVDASSPIIGHSSLTLYRKGFHGTDPDLTPVVCGPALYWVANLAFAPSVGGLTHNYLAGTAAIARESLRQLQPDLSRINVNTIIQSEIVEPSW